ncbi:alpha/beta hydrolase family protein [Rhizobium azibense]|uniref:Alpha/beta hydrolase family protein n=1 Tax=Rhizobium azibense TaxID=1136135 RepID=A0A4R3S1L1_9HYPH|nr:alpha/beta hydrolase family protein [Rhizobium azibense]
MSSTMLSMMFSACSTVTGSRQPIVGFSLGGMIGQVAALKNPERVLSLAAISTSPVGVDTSGLPASGEAWMEHMTMEADWSERADAVAYRRLSQRYQP